MDSGKRKWTNNNAEHINNILKLTVEWKPQGARELTEKIYRVTELYFLTTGALCTMKRTKGYPKRSPNIVYQGIYGPVNQRPRRTSL